MQYEKALVADKLNRWEQYLISYRLPTWESIPDIGLYMEQIVVLLKGYLDYLPPELKEEQFISAATINNYVRKKLIPKPKNKKYYREHIAYLLIICSLKQSLCLSMLQQLIPVDLPADELKATYTAFSKRHHISCKYFTKQVREAAAYILDDEPQSEIAAGSIMDFITAAAVVSGFSGLLAEKLILLDGKTLNDAEGSGIENELSDPSPRPVTE